jgi:hypothetical protein
MKKFLRDNGLSITFIVLFLVAITGQIFSGLAEHNGEMQEQGGRQLKVGEYLTSGHFIQATFENWESEFLQMALFVMLTIFLYQRGSSESKDPDGGEEEVDHEPDLEKEDAPWPVKQGGVVLALYKHSLSIVLFLLFAASFVAHWVGSNKHYNEEQALKHLPMETLGQYLGNSRFWFESFQNWQSEFLSVFAIVMLSVWLRQQGSSQSKPVDAPHSETGE